MKNRTGKLPSRIITLDHRKTPITSLTSLKTTKVTSGIQVPLSRPTPVGLWIKLMTWVQVLCSWW